MYNKTLLILRSNSFSLLQHLEVVLAKNAALPNVRARPFLYPDISFHSTEICWLLLLISNLCLNCGVHCLQSPQGKQPRGVSTTTQQMLSSTGKWKEDWEIKSAVQKTNSEDEKELVELETKVPSSLMWNTVNSTGLPNISKKKELTNQASPIGCHQHG